jgi:hypothetical protein
MDLSAKNQDYEQDNKLHFVSIPITQMHYLLKKIILFHYPVYRILIKYRLIPGRILIHKI